MKNLFLLVTLLFFTAPFLQGQSTVVPSKVLICNSTEALRYHSHYCSGLNKCTHSVSEVLVSEAKELGRTPCKICYSSTGSITSGTQNTGTTIKPSPSYGSGCSAVQCSGTTQKGLRCKNRTTNCSGRCYHHI